jgi:hypothetical protein
LHPNLRYRHWYCRYYLLRQHLRPHRRQKLLLSLQHHHYFLDQLKQNQLGQIGYRCYSKNLHLPQNHHLLLLTGLMSLIGFLLRFHLPKLKYFLDKRGIQSCI